MRQRIIGLAFLLGMALTFGQATASLAADPDELTLAVIRTEEMSTLAQRWDKAIEYLGRVLINRLPS